MKQLSDVRLIHAYKKAIELNLDENFIQLLKSELDSRECIEYTNSKEEKKIWK